MNKHTKKFMEADMQANETRARSVMVGTAFGGTTEISMRLNNGVSVWAILQPVETIELIHQLAANVGCHINLQPREDFSSWRGWVPTKVESLHPPFSNHPPHAIGRNTPQPEEQLGLNVNVPIKEQEDVVATKETVKRRSVKRTAKTA
jgi:hypothetical protein